MGGSSKRKRPTPPPPVAAEAAEAAAAEAAAAPTRRSKRARKAVNYKEPRESDVYETVEDGGDAAAAAADGGDNDDGNESGGGGLTVKTYRTRLVRGGKELYKDPPVLPVDDAAELPRCEAAVKRDAKSREFKFPDHPEFRPNLSPEEVLRMGSFGGTYFRSIDSAVVGRRISAQEALRATVPDAWIAGLEQRSQLTSRSYDVKVNKFQVKCGGSLGMWESSGWISNIDPYGWFQWYCRFFQGRRTTDDARQISRALKCMGPTGRFRIQLMNKVIRGNTTFDDRRISPVIRQSLQHWGYELTEAHLKAYCKKKGW
mmetsp:Transcript_40068/g.125429  ORF Transcript_40068/g.125429 Transcript_40068/m.125429 type:complete len:315 (-) Transcript_40068:940-1884(-)